MAISGHLTELNGKYKMRATEVTFELGGFLVRITTWAPRQSIQPWNADVGPQPQDQRN